MSSPSSQITRTCLILAACKPGGCTVKQHRQEPPVLSGPKGSPSQTEPFVESGNWLAITCSVAGVFTYMSFLDFPHLPLSQRACGEVVDTCQIAHRHPPAIPAAMWEPHGNCGPVACEPSWCGSLWTRTTESQGTSSGPSTSSALVALETMCSIWYSHETAVLWVRKHLCYVRKHLLWWQTLAKSWLMENYFSVFQIRKCNLQDLLKVIQLRNGKTGNVLLAIGLNVFLGPISSQNSRLLLNAR